jgi:hypothetical protein
LQSFLIATTPYPKYIQAEEVVTNLIDKNLLNEAQIIGHHKTKKETINIALLEYIQCHKQEKIINLFGTIEYDPKYNYKNERNSL